MTTKSGIVSDFRNSLYDIVTDAFDNGGSILRDMRGLVKQAVEDAYFDGLKEAGISPDEMTQEDAENIVQLNEEQQAYIPDFSKAVRDAAKDGSADAKNAIINRIDMWAANIEHAKQVALATAKKDEMVTWRLGATEKHCKTCSKLNGVRHRRSWFAQRNYWPGTPGTDTLDCGGWNCDCSLEPD